MDKLTEQQIASFGSYVDRWKTIGLCTDTIDQERATKAINRVYECAGLKAPKEVVFVRSPKEAKDMTGNSSFIYGQNDAYWLAFYEFFKNNGFESETAVLEGLWEFAKSAGWALCYEDRAIICDRPKTLKFDDRELLHCEDGPAIEFRDGFCVYSWHGVRIPGEWLKGGVTAEIALTHPNVEQRRAACEIYGWNNILRELNARTIDKSPNPFIGELLEVNIPDIGKERFLRVKCGTSREFALPVPPDMERATQAQAWLNFAEEKYFTNDWSART